MVPLPAAGGCLRCGDHSGAYRGRRADPHLPVHPDNRSGADFFVAYLHAVGENLIEAVAVTVIGVNLADKILSALIAWLLVRCLPQRSLRNFPQMAKVR